MYINCRQAPYYLLTWLWLLAAFVLYLVSCIVWALRIKPVFSLSHRETIISAAVLCLHAGAGWHTLPCQVSASTDYSTTTSASPRLARQHSSCCIALLIGSLLTVKPVALFSTIWHSNFTGLSVSLTRCPNYRRSCARPTTFASPQTHPNSLPLPVILRLSLPLLTSWSVNTSTLWNQRQVSLNPRLGWLYYRRR